MVATQLIREKIAENGLTISQVADKIGIAGHALDKKISNRAIMNLNEADAIQQILKIPDEEFRAYFFDN